MAQDCAWSKRNDSSHAVGMQCRRLAAYREHASVDPRQPAGPNPACDRIIAEADMHELRAGDYAMLASRE